ncbi:MAG TPA: nucleotide exchange factor GrpE [Bacillota bacterium]|nr:nucleotide exchange factor GrpE [Bacillota bacterium]
MEDKKKDKREKNMDTDESITASGKDTEETITGEAKAGAADEITGAAQAGRDNGEVGTDDNTATADDGPSLEQQLEDLRKKNEEYYDRLLRLQADFDNYRKRTAREREESYDYIAAEIVFDFLGVLDNMERAAETAAAGCGEGGSASLKEGIDMVVKQFRDILAKYHVEEIPTEGVKFDPNFHHAVMQEEDSDKEEGTILEVFQKGYKIKSRVLRPSFVKVAL